MNFICNTHPNIISIPIEMIDETTKNKLYYNYLQTYQSANQEIWYKTPNELFQSKYVGLITAKDYNQYYILYQLKSKSVKLSVICHNGTQESKKNLLNLIELLLKTKGFIMEASCAVSWILRKRNVPIIVGKKQIENALEIDDTNQNDIICINEDWDIMDKNQQYYCRQIRDEKSGNVYISNDTLFGML
jgi:hypothetical protein